jgi:hypothetical protein
VLTGDESGDVGPERDAAAGVADARGRHRSDALQETATGTTRPGRRIAGTSMSCTKKKKRQQRQDYVSADTG